MGDEFVAFDLLRFSIECFEKILPAGATRRATKVICLQIRCKKQAAIDQYCL